MCAVVQSLPSTWIILVLDAMTLMDSCVKGGLGMVKGEGKGLVHRGGQWRMGPNSSSWTLFTTATLRLCAQTLDGISNRYMCFGCRLFVWLSEKCNGCNGSRTSRTHITWGERVGAVSAYSKYRRLKFRILIVFTTWRRSFVKEFQLLLVLHTLNQKAPPARRRSRRSPRDRSATTQCTTP